MPPRKTGRSDDRGGAGAGVRGRARSCSCRWSRRFWCRATSGLGKRGAALSHLGDGKWSSTKKAAEKSIYDYAAKLLKIQAVRETHEGIAFGPDGTWQKEFEEAFPYSETADQVRAIAETKADMESGPPDGPSHLRRRGFRQNGGGHPRGVQGGHERQTGGDDGAHHRARAAALTRISARGWRRFPWWWNC